MEKTVRVYRVGASSIGRLVGVVNSIIALASGLIGSIVAVTTVIANNNYGLLMGIGVSIGIVSLGVIVVPIVAFAFGWLYGLLIGFIWNIILGTSGGLEVGIEDVPADTKK